MDDCSGAFIAATAPAQSADAAGGRSAILVLGMHRSGTSALTRVLNLLGAALPRHILGAGPGNETGHWEPLRLVGYHDRMLADLGSRWDDWRPLDLSQIAPEKRSQIKFDISHILKEEYGQAPLFVLKEPRICRFLPLYGEIFAEQRITARYVLPIRNPLAVAASLRRRDEMSEGFAALLWLRHAIDAERGTRGAPRVIVSYEALMADWRPAVEALGSSIPIAWPRSLAEVQSDIGSFVDGGLQHHAPSLGDLVSRREIPDCVKGAYAALLALEANPDDAAAIGKLDEIQSTFDSAAAIFGAATFPEIGARENVFARVRKSQAEEIDALAAMAQGREEEIVRLGAVLAAREKTLEELNLANTGLQARIAEQSAQIGGLEVTLSAYENQYADLGGLLTKQKATENTRMTAIGTLAKKLSAQETLIGEMNGTIGQTTAAVEDLTTELHLLRGSLSWRVTAPLRTISRRFPAVAQPFKVTLRRAAGIIRAPYGRAARELHTRWNSRLVTKSGLFDAAWYRDQYPDVKASGRSPVHHYLLHGAREGRDPSPYFYSRWYLANNPDVDVDQLNPLVHYIRHGAAEGRLPKPPYSSDSVETKAEPSAQPQAVISNAAAPASQIEPLRATAAAVGIVIKKAVAVATSLTSSELTNRVHHLSRLVRYTAQREIDKAALPPLDPSKLKITWIIPDFSPGAGGHMTIFRIAHYLESFGHEVTFLIQNPSQHLTGSAALAAINAHFQPFQGRVELLSETLPHITGDAIIATDRFTCYPVAALAGFRRKFYFVQDYEASFYPVGTESLLSEHTYHMGLDCLCAGNWLTSLMRDRYGLWAVNWPLAYDPTNYYADRRIAREDRRIAFYARYVTPRRAVELGMMAFDILHERGVSFHVDFFGWDLGNLRVPYSSSSHGVLPSEQLGALYRKSTVGMVFSATNHSLINKEMMACGLPVIDLDIESVRSIFPQSTITLAEPTPESIADALEGLLNDAERRDRLAHAGLDFIRSLSWNNSARIIEAAIIERVKISEPTIQ